ncbi:Uma2 family endonuclease [Dyadobacter luticola]|uniref:Uma2 family endonuclease n=1 Tax=Dyadobacter luticola TaxID=1979387 RepID=A0A5R9KQ00_9BACT|nr:Uma2 family endonuclease [Dyadobacter luticola]TLU98184.1 Uma2 family endonuclease [Dyadobacter luticola]
MIASPNPGNAFSKASLKKIPDVLIHEIIDGKPYYRKGYRDVLTGTKTVEDILGTSSLQAFIITYLIITIARQLDEEQYTILTNEAGLHLDKKNNLAGDILIFENTLLPIGLINKKYTSVNPKICIEVDTNIEIGEYSESSYITLKTRKLLDFGAEKVIWFLTEPKKVMIATSDTDWQIKDWDKDVEILDGIHCNVGKYLREKGSEFA